MKQRQLLPTVTVTVVALATVGWKARRGAIITTNSAKRREEVLIASVTSSNCKQSVARRQYRKSNAIVTFTHRRSGYRCAVFSTAKPSVGDLPLFETTGRIYDYRQIV
jgi:hypothetical protein